ncbi:hypothetical protein LOTGIDRAFT_207552 [Lottia gigantea]|uniref:Large ribosomal subunit protein eL6 n=1 Tax=Lottia gigantea TaxID=225164 RepID=V4BEH3_LOTGI|nr:hypothetical protein LOTGIDRAFT_207552 [Lottia gigantea]ESP04187.1 hypothetical protein LOTGIDRAFT_207552 [Lottia gigantea]
MHTNSYLRFSRKVILHHLSIYEGKDAARNAKAVKRKPAKGETKKVGGEKNGSERIVPAQKKPRYYPTETRPKKLVSRKRSFNGHAHKLRPSITPGTVLIVLAGKHKGKRVVYLKQLRSGLLLVTGPFTVNGCPLRRVNQIYVIATKTKLNIDNIKLPERLNDDYFKKKKTRKAPKNEGDLFESTKEAKTVSPELKEDQVNVDKQVLEAISKHPDHKLFTGYLKSIFWLKKSQFPHNMIF